MSARSATRRPVQLPPSRAPRRRSKRWVAVLVGCVLVVALAALGVPRLKSWLGDDHKLVEVTVTTKLADQPGRVTKLLVAAEVLSDRAGFHAPAVVVPGTYRLHRHSKAADVRAALRAGPAVPLDVTVNVPPGDRMGQILYQVNQAVPWFTASKMRALLRAGKVTSPLLPSGGVPAGELTPNGSPLEGLLYPARYRVTDFSSPVHLLQTMADKMAEKVDSLGGPAAAEALGVSTYQLVIIASMVQSEAASAEEAPKVARVIYNRLSQNKPLQIDATSVYAYCTNGTVTDCTTIDTSKLDFSSPSLYNTRHRPGLPPTPISNPSDYALDAAMHPADGPWLYYVLVDPHHHFFTDDYQQFLQMSRLCAQRELGCGSG